MYYNKPITIEKLASTADEIGNWTQEWQKLIKCRAIVNSIGGKEYYQAAQINAENDVNFTVRYCNALADITPQTARIIFKGKTYDITSIDNFMFQNVELKIRGVLRNE